MKRHLKHLTPAALARHALAQWRNPGRRQLLLMLAATVLGSAITLGIQLALSKVLPPDEFGSIRIILGYFWLAAPFVGLGLVAALGRLVVPPSAKPRRLFYWQQALRLWLPLALVITAIICGLALAGLITPTAGLALPLALLMCSLPIWNVGEFYQNFWKLNRARGMASVGLLVAKLGMLGGLVAVLAAPAFAGGKASIPLWFAAGFGAGSCATWLVLALMHRRCMATLQAPAAGAQLNAHEWKTVRLYVPMALLANVVNVLAAQLDVVLLDRFAVDAHVVGLYMFALMFANAILLVQDPVLSYLLPEMGQAWEHDRANYLKRVFKYQGLLLGVMVLLALAVLVAVPLMVVWVFNPAYQQAMVYLPAVVAAAVVQGNVGILSQGLFVRNQVHLGTLFTFLATCVVVVVSLALMPVLGVWGLIAGKICGSAGFVAMAVVALLRTHGEANASN